MNRLVTLFAAFFGFTFMPGWLYAFQDSVSEQLAKLKQDGFPVCIADLKPEAVADQENAAKYLAKASEHVFAIDVAMDRVSGRIDAPPSDEYMETFEIVFAKHIDAFVNLEEAAAAPKFAAELDYSQAYTEFIQKVMEESGQLRSVARVLGHLSKFELARGNADEAAESILMALRIIKKSNYPSLLSATSTGAAEGIALAHLNLILQQGDLSPEVSKIIDELLKKCDNAEILRKAMITERAIGLELIKKRKLGMVVSSRSYLKFFAQQLEEIEKLPFEAEPADDKKHGTTEAMLLPAIQMVQQVTNRTRCQVRALQFINLAGGLPDSANDEDWKNIANDIIDPYSGKPLVVHKLENGWLVYSVGPNGVDDDGDQSQDYGFAPPKR